MSRFTFFLLRWQVSRVLLMYQKTVHTFVLCLRALCFVWSVTDIFWLYLSKSHLWYWTNQTIADGPCGVASDENLRMWVNRPYASIRYKTYNHRWKNTILIMIHFHNICWHVLMGIVAITSKLSHFRRLFAIPVSNILWLEENKLDLKVSVTAWVNNSSWCKLHYVKACVLRKTGDLISFQGICWTTLLGIWGPF